MQDSSRLIKRTQIDRHKKQPKSGEDDGQHDEEMFNDDDFYRSLILNGIKAAEKHDQILKKFTESTSSNSKFSKNIKSNKGKIDYTVHQNLVGFMASEPKTDWNDKMRDELFSNLFQ